MTFTTIFNDSFTDTNGTALPDHDATWVNLVGACEIQSNAVADGASGGGGRSVLDLAVNDDQAAECTYIDSGSLSLCGVMCRHTDDGSGLADAFAYLAMFLSGGGILLLKLNGTGVAADFLGFNFDGHSPGDVLRLECVGTTIRALLNDAEEISVTDASYSSGQVGIYLEQADGQLDNFAVEHVSAAVVVSGPFHIAAAHIFTPGAVKASAHEPGASNARIFNPGAVKARIQ